MPFFKKVTFQQPSSSEPDELLRWSEQVQEYLVSIEDWARGIDAQSQEQTLWFDVPLRNFYKDTDPPVLLTVAGGGSNTPCLYYNEEVVPYLSWIALAYSDDDGDDNTETIYGVVRIPSMYIAGNDLTIRIAATVVCADDAIIPSTRTLDVIVRRNKPTSTQEGFGDNTNWTAGNPWESGDWNTDLCNTSIESSVAYNDAASLEFTDYDFDIEANDSSFPLTAGNLLLVQINGAITSGHATKDAVMYISNVRLGAKVHN